MIQVVPLTIVLLYMAGMLAVGFYTNRFLLRNSEDYLLAGRRLGPLFVAASLAANNIGGGSTIGVASKAFGPWGMGAGWYILAAAIGIIPIAIFAPYLRRVLATTVPEVVGRRFGTTSHLITAILNMASLFFLTVSQILASGIVIAALTGLDKPVAIILAGGITIAYTAMGGLMADVFTDMFQWLIIFFGLLIALPFVIGGAGGWANVAAHVPASKLSITSLSWPTIIGLMVMYFMTFLSGPEMVSRFYAAKNEKVAVQAAVLSGIIMGLFAFIPATIGIVALAVFPKINPNDALITAVFKLAPGWISGLVASAIIAATMSSADSDMLMASSIFTKDIYQKYINPRVPDASIVKITRAGNVVVGLGAMLIALLNINIITMNVFAFTLRSAGPFAAFVLALVWKDATKNAGLWSIILGSLAAFIWQYLKEPYGIMAIIFGSLVGLSAFIVITLLERAMGVKPAPSAYVGESES